VQGVAARAGNLARQLAQVPWFVRNVAIKGLLVAKLVGVAKALGHDGGPWPY